MVFKVVSTEFGLMLLVPLLIIIAVFYLRGPCGVIGFDERNGNQLFIRQNDPVSQMRKQCFLIMSRYARHAELQIQQSPLQLEGHEEHTYTMDLQADGSRIFTDTGKNVGTPGNTTDYSAICDGLEQRPEGVLFTCSVHILLSDPGTPFVPNEEFQ